MATKQIEKNKPKPVFEKFLPYLFFIFLGFCVADLLVMNFRDLMLPSQPPPARPKRSGSLDDNNRGAYNTITSRNIFNAEGVIPDPLAAEGSARKQLEDLPPVPSQLPLGLMGTIVHSNAEKSIANIEVRGKNLVLAYTINREIDKIATLTKIERNKVFLRNLNNNRIEYLEMKSTSKISFSGAKAPTAEAGKPVGNEVKQVAQNKFELKRADVLKYTSDMASVLQQAAMAPKRGANGEIEGFKFLSIQPGSIYTQLGFQNGDVIKGVNGEPVDSPAKAMELYNTLKSSNNIKIKVEREGRDTDFDYNVN